MNSSQHLRNLLVMALADGELSEREVNFITDRCAELGLGEEELRESLRYALEDEAALSLPKDAAAQELLLGDLVRMMAADGNLAENEKRLFALAAAKLGFDQKRLDSLFNRLMAK